MHLVKWLLKLLGLRLATLVGVSNRMTTSARPCSRLPQAGRWQQSKISSRKGSLLPSARRAAIPTGCPPSHTSRPLMHSASSTVPRSRPTKPLGSATGSPRSPRVTDSSPLRLPARRLLPLSSRRLGQSVRFKMNILKSTEPTSCSPAWPTTGAADGSSNKKCKRWPQVLQNTCIGLRSSSIGAGPTTQK